MTKLKNTKHNQDAKLNDFLSLREDDFKDAKRDPQASYKSIADARFTKRPLDELTIKAQENIDGRYIKHMAFAVKDARAALKIYQDYLGVAIDAEVHDYQGSSNRVAVFNIGNVEYQLCQSLDEGGRFDTWIKERGSEGLHHICYAVPNIDKALADAQTNGATLKECVACKVKGSHVHPEGWVAFLDQEVGGIELELMQVYTPEEVEEYKPLKGI